MFPVTLPSRSADMPELRSDNYLCLKDYWIEGKAYQITATQADMLRQAAVDILARFKDAINYVVSTPEVLDKFVFSGRARGDVKIRRLIKASWDNEESRRYLIDRWDIGWDGINPPKLLERNFGHLGLVVATGPVQEQYTYWLAKQEGYRDVRSFGSLQENFVHAFREVAGGYGIFPTMNLAVAGQADCKNSDPEMWQAARAMESWIRRAGFMPALIDVHQVSYEKGYTLLNRYFKSTVMAEGKLREKGQFEPLETRETSTAKSKGIYIFADFDRYARYVALYSSVRRPVPPQKTISIEPFWTLLGSHKGMLAVLHELFPSHPNFLPTYWGTKALQGERRIVKHVLGLQGYGSTIWNANGDKVIERNKKGAFAEHKGELSFITQAYCDAVAEPDGGYKVFNLFTTNGRPAALGMRVAPGPFVGGNDTGTRFMPVIVRSVPSSFSAPGGIS